MSDEVIDWSADLPPAAPRQPQSVPVEASSTTPRGRRTPLPPLWKLVSVLAADEQLILDAQQVTQLRTHCLCNPPSASFKDAARYLSYIACETTGIGHRLHVRAPTPSAPVLTMTVRAMTETPHIHRAALSIFEEVAGAVHGRGLPPGAAPMLSATAFKEFMTAALVRLCKGLLPPKFAEAIAVGEWRGARSHSSTSAAAKNAVDGHAALGIPFPAFCEKLLTMSLLFTSNGAAFATPIAAHLLELLDDLSLVAASGAHTAPIEMPVVATVHAPMPANELQFLANGSLIPITSPRSNPDDERPAAVTGFLPPSRPLTYQAAITATASSRHVRVGTTGSAGSSAFVGSARLPLILTKRQVDSFAVPADMSDGAVGSSVGAGPTAYHPYTPSQDINATRLRNALHARELYPTRPKTDKSGAMLLGSIGTSGSAAVTGDHAAVIVPRQVGGASTGAIQRSLRGGFRTAAAASKGLGQQWKGVEMDMFSRGAGSKAGDVVNIIEQDGVRFTEPPAVPPNRATSRREASPKGRAVPAAPTKPSATTAAAVAS